MINKQKHKHNNETKFIFFRRVDQRLITPKKNFASEFGWLQLS